MKKYIYILGIIAIFLGGSISSVAAAGTSTQSEVLINHAVGGSTVSAPNYEAGIIPEGVGIPHTLINSIPKGDYFAVVFFKGLPGCPSTNYAINSFRANAYWGYDILGPMQGFSRAWSTSAGGCMQEYHVNPARGDDWLWGALSNTGTSTALADSHGIPAFAICASAKACDPIAPGAGTGTITEPGIGNPSTELSSVLFLPGIKGSRLYEENPLCLVPGENCEIPLWLPISDLSAPGLFMDTNGKSIRNVYVKEGDILAHAYGQHFYDAFSERMGAYAAKPDSGDGWRWKAVAYDWRLSLPDIVNTGVQQGSRIYYGKATSTPYIEQSLRDLASTSPTGKVTIISHSNGGLVAKALMQRLGDSEAAKLVDSVIFVGVPQSGSPRALASLLYGDSENLPGFGVLPNALLSKAHARTFALNSPMAYHLLPSLSYFRDVQDPNHALLKFSEGTLFAKERAAYGATIDSSNELHQYGIAAEGGRSTPSEINFRDPTILNNQLLTYTEQTHSIVDSWRPPEGVSVYQIAGWGTDTISGITQYELTVKSAGISRKQRSHRPVFVEDGDGTVTVPSALMMTGASSTKQYWAALPTISDASHSYEHSTLFEAPEIESLISNIMEHVTVLPRGITRTRPAANSTAKKLLFVLHGPATISITSSRGGRLLASGSIGDSSYVLMPANETHTAQIIATGPGTVALDIEELNDDVTTSQSTISDIAVSSSTSAQITVQGTDEVRTASPVLAIDENTDGTVERTISLQPGLTVSADESVEFPVQTQPQPPSSEASSEVSMPTPTPVSLARSVGRSSSTRRITSAVPTSSGELGLPKVLGAAIVVKKNVILSKKVKTKKVLIKSVAKKKLLVKSKPLPKKVTVCTKSYCPISIRKSPVTKSSKGPAKK